MTELSEPVAVSNAATAPSNTMTLGRRLLWLGPTGIVVAVGLSVVAWLQVRSPEDAGSLLAAATALLMTAPVVLARRWPTAAAFAIAAGAVLNGLLFPDLVRCAAAFPAALYVAFAVGAWAGVRTGGRPRRWIVPFVGLLLVLGNLLAQYAWDPILHAGAGFLAFGPPLAVVVWGAGIGWSRLRVHLGRGRPSPSSMVG